MTYDNNFSMALFAAKTKRSDKSPDYTGVGEVDRVEYWTSAWVKENSNTGKKYLSVSFTLKDGMPSITGVKEFWATLQRVDSKETERHPDFKGEAFVEGEQYELAGWERTIKRGKNAGGQMISVKLTAENRMFIPRSSIDDITAAPIESFDDFSDDIPFMRKNGWEGG
ncbi:hypothetical protein [Zhongshania sp.]|uniref:hypothetical protein n=1 Tax=Zhongshania sp. TaxID=1971902 RepID=UPI003567B180